MLPRRPNGLRLRYGRSPLTWQTGHRLASGRLRVVALALLVSILGSATEVVRDEGSTSGAEHSGLIEPGLASVPAELPGSPLADCACLCACSCSMAQVAVVAVPAFSARRFAEHQVSSVRPPACHGQDAPSPRLRPPLA
jgi:hypothetical protein